MKWRPLAHSRTLHHCARCGGEIGSRLRDFLKLNRTQKTSRPHRSGSLTRHDNTHCTELENGEGRAGRESTGRSHVALSYSWMADVIHARSLESRSRPRTKDDSADRGRHNKGRKKERRSVCLPASHDGLVSLSVRPTDRRWERNKRIKHGRPRRA